MLRGDDRNRLLGDVNAKPKKLFIDIGEMFADKLGRLVADIEVNIIKAKPFNLMVDCARNNIAGSQFLTLVKSRHKAFAGGWQF